MRIGRCLGVVVGLVWLSGCPDESGDKDAGGVPDTFVAPGADAAVSDVMAPDVFAPDVSSPDVVLPDSAGGEDSAVPEEDAAAPEEDAAVVEDAWVDPCLSAPCFPGVTCTADGSNFVCGECPSGLGGDGITCTEIDGCANAPCLPTTTCTDIPAPGVGFACTACTDPSCPIFRALAGPDQEIIAGTTATLEGSATDYNGSFTCLWSNNRDATTIAGCTAVVSPVLETIYTLETTDASGAVANDDVVIGIVSFIADAGPDANLVFGQTATLTASWAGASCTDASCITCEWRLSDQTLVATTCTTTVSPSATSQYFVTISDLGNNQNDSDSATVFITDQPAQLCGWNVVVMTSNEYPSAPNPNYICDSTGTARRQTINGKPAIVLSDLVVSNVRIVGNMSVETGADDDLIGFLWGWQNPKHSYLLTWKQLNQNWTANCGNAPAGIAVKKIDGDPAGPTTISFNPAFGFNGTDYEYSCAIGWSQLRANAALFGDNSIFLIAPGDPGGVTVGWTDSINYRFEFYYTPAQTKVLVYADDQMTGSTANLVASLLIVDSSYPEGAFAFFSNSQEQVAFGDFTLAALDSYAAEAGPDLTISAGATAMLTGSAELAVPPYSCEWSEGVMTVPSVDCVAAVAPLVDTTYTLTVTDDFGRTASDSLTVIVGP